MQYKLGKWYQISGTVVPCENGFHFCKNILDLPEYWNIYEKTRIFEVDVDGVLINAGTKNVAEKICLVREIPKEEWNTKEMQLAAVNEDGLSIKYIENPDKDIQLAAVQENGYAIEYIENPDKDISR